MDGLGIFDRLLYLFKNDPRCQKAALQFLKECVTQRDSLRRALEVVEFLGFAVVRQSAMSECVSVLSYLLETSVEFDFLRTAEKFKFLDGDRQEFPLGGKRAPVRTENRPKDEFSVSRDFLEDCVGNDLSNHLVDS